MCVRLNRMECHGFSANQASIELAPGMCHQVAQQQTAQWSESSSYLSSERADGWWDGCKGRGGMTYCRFCSYSCGGTVIISPLLLNSVILSYISRARGQEILQFINRSSLCKGDYCMAYTLTSLFSLKDFFPPLDSPSYLVSVSAQWCFTQCCQGLSYSHAVHTLCDLLCVCVSPCHCVRPFPWTTGQREIRFPISYDKGLLWLKS